MRRGRKGEIFALLEREAYEEILALFDVQPDGVRRYLTLAAYAPEESISEAAVKGFGFLARARGQTRPEFFRETLRRHLWAMNDESGNMDWRGPEIIAQIVAAQPGLFGAYASYMLEAALAEPVFYPSLKKAVALLVAADPQLIVYQRTRLKALGLLA